MDIYQLLILQIVAHILADFTFQSDLWSRHKRRFGFGSSRMYWHALIVFFISYLFSLQWNFIFGSLAISIVHLFVDSFKVKMGNFKISNTKPFKNLTFFIDQLIHIGIISLVVLIYTKLNVNKPYIAIPVSGHHLIVILGYLLCLKPANIFIREVFNYYNIKIEIQPSEDLMNAGKLIGNIERVLTLTLLLIGQYEAIGFLIAGKSILRYEGTKTSKTEYVLIGTLLSFGIAILIGTIILKLKI